MGRILKGYKITNASRDRSFGIATSSLTDFRKKAASKFKVGLKEKYHLYLQDGTIVDDESYFSTLPPQTVFVLVKDGEEFLSGADIFYKSLANVNVDVLRAGGLSQSFLSEALKGQDITDLIALVEEDKTLTSSRDDHPEWFADIDTRCRDKESFMNRRCRERIRGYFYSAKSEIRKSEAYRDDKVAREHLDMMLNELVVLLEREGYFGRYFDRRKKGESLCDSTGLFMCQGLWSEEKCNYKSSAHTINPYRSKEDRIVFSTWNLDHRIEKKRTIVPTVISGAMDLRTRNGETLNSEYFFRLLFTTDNLKLVHIVCHDKGAHTTATCDPKLVFAKAENVEEIDKRTNELIVP